MANPSSISSGFTPIRALPPTTPRLNLPGTIRPVPAAPSVKTPLSEPQFNSLGTQSQPIRLPDPESLAYDLSEARNLIKGLDPEQRKMLASELMSVSEDVAREYGMSISFLDRREDYANGPLRQSAEKVHIGRDLALAQVRGDGSNEMLQGMGRLNLSRSQERAVLCDLSELISNCVPDEVGAKGAQVRGSMCMELPSCVRSDRVFMSVGNSEMLATYEVGALASYDKIHADIKGVQAHFGLSEPQMAQLLRSSSSLELEQQLRALAPTHPPIHEALRTGAASINVLHRSAFLTQALEVSREPKMAVLNEVVYALGESGSLSLGHMLRPDSDFGLMTFGGASSKSPDAAAIHQERAFNTISTMVNELLTHAPRLPTDELVNNQLVHLTLELGKVIKGQDNQLAAVCHNILWSAEGPADSVRGKALGDIQGSPPTGRPTYSSKYSKMLKTAQSLGIERKDMQQALITASEKFSTGPRHEAVAFAQQCLENFAGDYSFPAFKGMIQSLQ